MNTIINVISPIVGSVMGYSYPTQKMDISNLLVNTTYNYCVVAVDVITMIQVGEPLCGNFKTPS